MSTDAKKHTSLAAGEVPSRAALAASILSINDVVPVANLTEATQVAAALALLGQSFATQPLLVARADARGLHRVEITYNGTDFQAVSGVPSFPNKAAADTFGSANSALLSIGDRCVASGVVYRWSGSAWHGLSARMKRAAVAKSINNTTWNQTLSTSNLWTEDWREPGIAAYSDGWTIPFAGEWEIDFGAVFSGATDIGIAINKTTIAGVADLVGYASGPTGASPVGMPQAIKRLRLASGDVVRLFGAAVPASVTWDQAVALSWFGIKFVGD